jgi:UDP-glucose 4-epimerase
MADTAKPMTWFVTGGSGFIGSHLITRLLAEGHRVLALDNLVTSSADNLAGVISHPNFHFARASIMDDLVVDRLASQAQVLVHLAAAVGVQRVVDDPVGTIETNVGGTEKVLKAALRYNCRTLIASTSEVYGKGSKIPFSEDDDVLLGPTSRHRWGYAASKMLDEFLALAYAREFGLQVVPFRLFNTVGPRQTGTYGMVVPRFVVAALKGEPLIVHGDGLQSRCFCDVRDVITAIIGLAMHPSAPGRVYNIGSSEEISIMGLAERVKALCGSQSPIRLIPYSEAYPPGFEDMRRRLPDTTRVNDLIGWQPTRTLDDILTAIIAHERLRLGKL